MTERLIFCSLCETNLPAGAFRKDRVTAGTVRDRCRKCNSKKAREWNLDHPDRFLASAARYRNTPKGIASSKLWRINHAEYLSKYTRQWIRDNPDKWKAICRRTRQKNLDKILIRNREREILQMTAMPAWADKEKIRSIYARARSLTRSTGVVHHVDHIIPIRGKNVCGLHVEHNLQILTATENIKKGNRVVGVFA